MSLWVEWRMTEMGQAWPRASADLGCIQEQIRRQVADHGWAQLQNRALYHIFLTSFSGPAWKCSSYGDSKCSRECLRISHFS